MGLYLCIFDDSGKELDGVDVGLYEDFGVFRDVVAEKVEGGIWGSVCPVLNNHVDNDGEWSCDEANFLILELSKISEVLRMLLPVEYNSEWKKSIAKTFGIRPSNLLECFFDVDGEPLVDRLLGLAQLSVDSGNSIIFQ